MRESFLLLARIIGRALIRPSRGVLPRLLGVAAIAAVLAPSMARYAGPETAGWFAGHGHVYTSAAAAAQAHTHPWDAPPLPHDHASGAADHAPPTPGVLFTLGDLGTLGGFAVPSALLLAVAWQTRAVEAPPILVRGLTLVPVVPPPQA